MEAEKIALDDLAKTVEQKQNQVDAHFLYNNEEGAKKILDELKGLMGQLRRKLRRKKNIMEKSWKSTTSNWKK